jgi:DNA-3-methyladenine glycosylase II
MIKTFNKDVLKKHCDLLARSDKQLNHIVRVYGYPPMWTRPQNFASLIHIILEQQVSLASAKAAFEKLKAKIGIITPPRLVLLTDDELRECYFSRQKTIYARELASAIMSKKIVLRKLAFLPDDAIRHQLTQIKGIGNWTVDVYLLFALKRADVFPVGDLAMVNALKEVKKLPASLSKEGLLAIAEKWKPYRSIACMLLWHYYIMKRKKVTRILLAD